MTTNILLIVGAVLVVLGIILVIAGGKSEDQVGLALTGAVAIIFGCLVLLGPLIGFVWSVGRAMARLFWS